MNGHGASTRARGTLVGGARKVAATGIFGGHRRAGNRFGIGSIFLGTSHVLPVTNVAAAVRPRLKPLDRKAKK